MVAPSEPGGDRDVVGRVEGRPYNPRVKRLLAAIALTGMACAPRSPVSEGIRTLPIRGARALAVGFEARPARLVMGGERLVWTIPSSAGATLEIGLTRLAGDIDAPAVVVTATRSDSSKAPLGATGLRSTPGWQTWRLPWKPHARPVQVEVRVEKAPSAVPAGVPAATLVAEPLLVPETMPRPRSNAIVFLVDTLRADRLGCYGAADARTPQIDRLAREGLLVERALSAANWTLPAHASLFTSTGVATHEVGGFRSSLSNGLPTLAEVLQRDGYRTLAVTNGGFLDPHFGLARGFERYLSLDIENEPVETSLKRAVRLMEESRSSPFFLFFHTFQVHQYSHRQGDPEHRDEERAAAARRLRRQYDEEVSRTDAALGVLRSELRRLGLSATTDLVFTSDHGEILGDGQEGEGMQWGHGSPYLRDNENRIPLIVLDSRHPGGGRRLDAPVSIIDVAPTTLSLLGVAREPRFEGIDFAGGTRGAIPPSRLRVTEEPHSETLAVDRGGRKLIVRPDRSSLRSMWVFLPFGALDPLSGYDVSRDPGERDDLIPGNREREFDPLLADAAAVVAARFGGDIVIRIPAGDSHTDVAVALDSGIRGWRLFSGGEPSRSVVTANGNRLTARLAPSRGPGWLVIEPRRSRDGFTAAVVSREAPVLGNGTRIPTGESRWSWDALAGSASDPSSILISASGSLSSEMTSETGPITSEAVARLRSLGYVHFRDPASSARLPPLLPGEGSGKIRLRWSAEAR